MSDDDDFVFFGKPIEREEEVTTGKKKAVAEASGQLRTALAPWKQEVRDEEGRRRFHGAFTGGYSAGYYNTVGSKEGWTPQTFTSSRKNRAEVKEQNIYNFLDEDEKSELEDRSLATSMQFDTFGSTAAELARKQAEKEQQQRPSTIPGPVPDELLVPTTDSIGVKLLLKMGWRQGRSIKDSNRNSLNDAKREARKAFLALSSDQLSGSQLDDEDGRNFPDHPTENDERFIKTTPAYVLVPKQDLYGLGFDPFKQAPEFREMKRQRTSGRGDMGRNMSLSLKSKVGPGFGIGALENLDAEDEDVYSAGYDAQHTYVQEIEEPSRTNAEVLRISDGKQRDTLPGFKVASNLEDRFERFDPPIIPDDFTPHHKFTAPLGNNGKISEIAPPEVSPPEDSNLKIMIEGLATLVARCGKLFEDLSREKNQSNPLFDFLNGGTGSDFYERKLWEELQKRGEQSKLWEGKKSQNNSEKLTAEGRGKILGEKALESSSKNLNSLTDSHTSVTIQFHLSDTFTKPGSAIGQPNVSKPFCHDPEKQQRYEQFLKEKYEGGLRSKDSGGFSNISESARARERLEFEYAAENSRSGKESKDTNQLLAELTGSAALQFTAGGMEKANEEVAVKAMYPKREEFQWRPSSILCKRFDLIDPYLGKPPPAPRIKTKIDSLFFMPDSVKTTSVKEPSLAAPKGKQGRDIAEEEVETDHLVEVENVERPIDLYKAIFSDSEDEEEDNTSKSLNEVPENIEKKSEVVNTTLTRLIAGDFLESLGKELGLEVPTERLQSVSKANEFAQHPPNPVMGTSTNGEKTKADEVEKKRNLESSPEKHRRKHSSHSKHKSSRRSGASSDESETSYSSDDYRDRKRSSSKRRKEKGFSKEKRSHHDRHRSSKHKRNDTSSNQRCSREYDEDRKRKKHRYDD